MKKFFTVLLCIFFMSFLGCAATQSRSSVCNKPEAQDSVICDTFGNLGMSVEQANLLFKVANVALIQENAYTKESFLKFLDETERLVDTSGSYMNLALYIISAIEAFNYKHGVELIMISDYLYTFNQTTPITSYDQYLLKEHIKQQRNTVNLLRT